MLSPSRISMCDSLGRPKRSISVGKMSMVDAGKSVVAGAMRPGHSMIPGTRMPPSQRLPLCPLNPPTESGSRFRPPLSLQYQTKVFFSISRSRRPFRSRPTLRSIPTISPRWSATFVLLNSLRSSFKARCGLWGEPYQITAKNGFSAVACSSINLSASITVMSEESP